MCSGLWPTLSVDIGNDLHVVFRIDLFEVILNGLGLRRDYNAWDAIAKLRLKLARRCVSRRSSVSFIIHRFLPLLTTAHWMILPMVDLVHPRQHRPCVSRTHDTQRAPSLLAQMDILPRFS